MVGGCVGAPGVWGVRPIEITIVIFVFLIIIMNINYTRSSDDHRHNHNNKGYSAAGWAEETSSMVVIIIVILIIPPIVILLVIIMIIKDNLLPGVQSTLSTVTLSRMEIRSWWRRLILQLCSKSSLPFLLRNGNNGRVGFNSLHFIWQKVGAVDESHPQP